MRALLGKMSDISCVSIASEIGQSGVQPGIGHESESGAAIAEIAMVKEHPRHDRVRGTAGGFFAGFAAFFIWTPKKSPNFHGPCEDLRPFT